MMSKCLKWHTAREVLFFTGSSLKESVKLKPWKIQAETQGFLESRKSGQPWGMCVLLFSAWWNLKSLEGLLLLYPLFSVILRKDIYLVLVLSKITSDILKCWWKFHVLIVQMTISEMGHSSKIRNWKLNWIKSLIW